MELVFNTDKYDTVLISCKQKIDYYDSDYIVSCIQKNIAKNISNLVAPYIEFEMVDDSIIGEYKYCSHPKTIKSILKVLKKKKNKKGVLITEKEFCKCKNFDELC